MRELTTIEMAATSGGFNCIDPATFEKVQDRAIRDAITFSIIGTVVMMAAVSGVTWGHGPLVACGAAAGIGVFVAPYVAIAGYMYSSSWNIFKA